MQNLNYKLSTTTHLMENDQRADRSALGFVSNWVRCTLQEVFRNELPHTWEFCFIFRGGSLHYGIFLNFQCRIVKFRKFFEDGS